MKETIQADGTITYEAETEEEWAKAKAFAAERHAALDALGDLGLTDESYWSGGEAATS